MELQFLTIFFLNTFLWNIEYSIGNCGEQLSPKSDSFSSNPTTFEDLNFCPTINTFPRKYPPARRDQFWKPWQKMSRKKIKTNSPKSRKDKKITPISEKRFPRIVAGDRRVQIWQKCRSFSPTSQKIFHSMPKSGGTFLCFAKE